MNAARVGPAVLLLVLGGACSSKTGDPSCGSACTNGCCNAYGACESGLLAKSCGRGGATCAACDDGVKCASGVCEVPRDGGPFPCGNLSCDSKFSDICLDGACSCGGVGACMGGAVCTGGHCQCDSTNCSGCCQGTTCLPMQSQDSSQCGTGGAACANCNATGGDTCSAGVCTCAGRASLCPSGQACVVSTCECNYSSCLTGCCSDIDSTCMSIAQQTFLSCGGPFLGSSCAACDSTVSDACTGGACTCGDGGQCDFNQTCKFGACH